MRQRLWSGILLSVMMNTVMMSAVMMSTAKVCPAEPPGRSGSSWGTSRGLPLEPDAVKARPALLVNLALKIWLCAQNLHRETTVLELEHFDEAHATHSRVGIGRDPETGDLLVYVTGSRRYVPTELWKREPARFRIADPSWPLRISQDELSARARTSELRELVAAVPAKAPPGVLRSRLSPAARDKLTEIVAFHDLVIVRQAEWIASEQGSDAVGAAQLTTAARLLWHFPEVNGWSGGYAFPARAHASALNITYSAILQLQRRYGRFDGKRLRELEAGIAGMELAVEAGERLRCLLGALARRLWLVAQEGIPKAERFFVEEAEMSAAIRRSLPYETDGAGQVTFFPASSRAIVHQDFDMDAYRESAQAFGVIAELLWEHGRFAALSSHAGRVGNEAPSRNLLALDLKATGALSELIVNYTVLLLHTAGELAHQDGEKLLLPEHLDAANRSLQSYEDPVPKDLAPEPVRTWDGPAPIFSDVTREVGLQPIEDPLELDHPGSEGPPLMSLDAFRGVATVDFDRDTYPDLFIAEERGSSRLYRNTGDGRFQDVTRAVGLGGIARVSGAYFADYDNDGCVDLLILRNYLSSLLFRQRCNYISDSIGDPIESDGTSSGSTNSVTFEDVTRQAGLHRGGLATTGALWLDYDNDGHLDLYLTTSGDFEQGYVPARGNFQNAEPNLLWRNLGDGTFIEVTQEAGVGDRGLSLASAAIDFDNDGDRDIFVANDMQPDVLYENLGDGRFRNIAPQAGVDDPANGMGVSVGDANQDGWMDLYVTNVGEFFNPDSKSRHPPQANRLFLNQGDGTFRSVHPERFKTTATGWGWNGFFFDFDNDSHLDIYALNGFRPDYLAHNSQSNILFRFDPETRRYHDLSAISGADFASYSRGSVFLDYDQDGDLDLVVTGLHSPIFLRNEVQRLDRRWLELGLVGRSSNRDAFGARVKVVCGDLIQHAEVGQQGGGFISSIHGALHFGLGSVPIVERIEIRWPSGIDQTLSDVAVNQRLVIREPESQ